MKSIDYDVDLDFLLDSPKTPVKSVNGDGSDDGGLEHSLRRTTPLPLTDEVDCLITPNKSGTMAVDRPAKVPSIDRSTKPPSSAVLNNSVKDAAVISSQPSASITRINNKLTSDKNVELPNAVSDTRPLNKPGPATIDPSTRSTVQPAAPDRSTKPVPPATSSSAKLEKEQAELYKLQAKKQEEASAVANLMREKRKLEMEVEKKKQLIDSRSGTE